MNFNKNYPFYTVLKQATVAAVMATSAVASSASAATADVSAAAHTKYDRIVDASQMGGGVGICLENAKALFEDTRRPADVLCKFSDKEDLPNAYVVHVDAAGAKLAGKPFLVRGSPFSLKPGS